MSSSFTKKETEILILGLNMYKKKLKKLLKDGEDLKAGEQEIKKTFLDTEKIIMELTRE